MRSFFKYLLSGATIWVIVDYTTAFNPDTVRWIQHMPDIWIFYFTIPINIRIFNLRKKLE
jgi:hypothetical protein